MTQIKQIKINTIEDSIKFAGELAQLFQLSDTILLEGNLGTGKTFLVKEICKIWKTYDEASSPSFAILLQYNGPIPVNHFDLYRINNIRELDNLGWEEHLNNGSVTFIEWPGIIEKQLKKYYKLKLEFDNQSRIFTLSRAE
ncbi:MAG: tRNA (adenosine(37)-N6)-threonylcarbamoyltransferase complex ATPase subunit type 1 TsaE [Calditrichaceae bacterium]|nr:tRNA (adenosine(37)-N6)-threonylcarbamoyltransferase complex ATPase subunit type 1 TsaE [Calditrichaceae bacterium]HES60146.1 tRNA (adenosine(37)-N6)-threonylcarbamoyltransferase complex ATPase subunit type 1 TsaE [Caldithrix sp.]